MNEILIQSQGPSDNQYEDEDMDRNEIEEEDENEERNGSRREESEEEIERVDGMEEYGENDDERFSIIFRSFTASNSTFVKVASPLAQAVATYEQYKLNIVDIIFRGFYLEKKFFEGVNGCRDAILLHQEESLLENILVSLFRDLQLCWECEPFKPWFGLSTQTECQRKTLCALNTCIWTKLNNLPYGEYVFRIKRLNLVMNEVILKVEVLNPIREIEDEDPKKIWFPGFGRTLRGFEMLRPTLQTWASSKLFSGIHSMAIGFRAPSRLIYCNIRMIIWLFWNMFVKNILEAIRNHLFGFIIVLTIFLCSTPFYFLSLFIYTCDEIIVPLVKACIGITVFLLFLICRKFKAILVHFGGSKLVRPRVSPYKI